LCDCGHCAIHPRKSFTAWARLMYASFMPEKLL